MMKHLLIAAASALVIAGPVAARPGNGHGHGSPFGFAGAPPTGHGAGYGVGRCPPGLARKAVPCVPPGQAKKLFGVGQRVPPNYRGLLRYNALPPSVRSRYGRQLSPYSRYIYENGYIYRVDPRTMVVLQVLSALARPH